MCTLPVNVTTNTYFFHMNNIAKYSGVCVYPNALFTFYIFFKKSSFRQDNVTTIVHMCLLDVLVRYSAVVSALFGRFRAQFGKAT